MGRAWPRLASTQEEVMADEPVSRILSSAYFAKRIMRRGDHSSSPRIATGIQQPTRGFSIRSSLRRHKRSALPCENALSEPGRLSPPIWPCTTRGFPCPRCYHRSGGLLPHLFTLAKRREHFVGVSQVSLCDATALHSAGGLFSVALSVNSSTGFSLCSSFCAFVEAGL